jgi:hypothetical protein
LENARAMQRAQSQSAGHSGLLRESMQPVSSFCSFCVSPKGCTPRRSHCKEQWNFIVYSGLWAGVRGLHAEPRARNRFIAPSVSPRGAIMRLRYEPTTIEAQSASFNFANTLICAVGSSARHAVPAAIETSTFPNRLAPPPWDRPAVPHADRREIQGSAKQYARHDPR